MSTFAARMCSSAFSQGVFRETFVLRGRSVSIARWSPGASTDGDPVADRRHPAEELVVAHAASGMREVVSPRAAHEVAATVLGNDARRLEAAFGVLRERGVELVRPAERRERLADTGHLLLAGS